MKLADFNTMLEVIAPAALAQEYDNVGLLIGTEREINRVLVALDCSLPVAEEAVREDVDLVLTHHPLFFHGVKRISPTDPETAAAYRLIRHGIGMFAAHTNLDAAKGGVNDALAEALGIEGSRPLTGDGLGRVGLLPGPTPLSEFVRECEQVFGIAVRYAGDPNRMIRRVGLCGGAGGEFAAAAADMGCDVYLTGEMKHHEAIDALARGIALIEAGHYQTEAVVLEPLIERLQNAERWITHLQNPVNSVQYILSRAETAPWKTREEVITT